MFIVTKQAHQARLYRGAKDQLQDKATVTLSLAQEIRFADVSAGDISPSGRDIILRRENAALLWTRRPGESIAAALARTPVSVPIIGPPRETNGESIAFHPDGQGYFTLSEGKGQPIYFFRSK